jgi:hypothetical protein
MAESLCHRQRVVMLTGPHALATCRELSNGSIFPAPESGLGARVTLGIRPAGLAGTAGVGFPPPNPVSGPYVT